MSDIEVVGMSLMLKTSHDSPSFSVFHTQPKLDIAYNVLFEVPL
jgi:hypothetical protein